MNSFTDPKFVIAYTIILGFAAAYINRPDDTMNGALIAAFAGAWGFYLGSSNSSNQVREQVGKALDIAAANSPALPLSTVAAADKVAGAAQSAADDIKGE